MQHKSILANSKKSKRQYQQQDPESGVLGKDHSDPSDDHHLLRTANETLRIENKNLKRILVALSIVLVLSIGGLVGAAVVVAVGSTSSTSTTTTTTPENDPEALAPSTSTSIATATATAPPKTTIVYFWPDSDENTTIPSSLYEPSTPVTTTASTNSTSNGNSAGDATPETDTNDNENDNDNSDTAAGDKPDLVGEPPSGVEVITASDLFD